LFFHLAATWQLGGVNKPALSTSRHKATPETSKSTSFSTSDMSGREVTYASPLMTTPPEKLSIFSELMQIGPPPTEHLELRSLHDNTDETGVKLLRTSQNENCKQTLTTKGLK